MEDSAGLLGFALPKSGQAAEAEAHYRECLEASGPKGRPLSLDETFMLSSKGFFAEALAMQGRKVEALALHMDLERLSSYEGDWTAYYQDLQEQFEEYEGNDDTEPGELDIAPHLTSILHDTNTTAAQAAQTATVCQERGDLEGA